MSAVTAVPLRPLARRSVLKLWIALALLILAATALGWWGTGWLQEVRLESGAHYRVLDPGTGPAFARQDAAAIHVRLHVNSLDSPVISDTEEDEDGPQPVAVSWNLLAPGMRGIAESFRTGGRYILWVPASVYIGGPVPPGAPFGERDTLVMEIRVLQVAPNQATALETQRLQQMMQRQQAMEQLQRAQGGNSAAPAADNGAAPAGAR